MELTKSPGTISIIPAGEAKFEQKWAGGTLLWTPCGGRKGNYGMGGGIGQVRHRLFPFPL
jgi:hypothetical protein